MAKKLYVRNSENTEWVEVANSVQDISNYLTINSASSTYATKSELENIDLSSASAAAVAAIVDSAPETLNTLNELAAALGDDENFATTVTTSLSNKLDISTASATYATQSYVNEELSNIDLTDYLTNSSASSTYVVINNMSATPVYKMNSGTTDQRPTGVEGLFRFNSTTGYPEWYDSITSSWLNFYQERNPIIEYLVIAGGGGGQIGGGGAGGLLTGEREIVKNISYTITIGSGGVGQSANFTNNGTSGQNTTFADLVTIGGGKGGGLIGSNQSQAGADGGSGGGGGSGGTGTVGQGNNGGSNPGFGQNGCGGGGGATAIGSNASSNVGGAGGTGFDSTITASSVNYAAGGGGGAAGAGGAAGGSSAGAGVTGGGGNSGSANRGGGGGGNWNSPSGGNGGSGVVILSYPSVNTLTIGAGLTGTTATVGANKVTTFTAGTGTVSFS